MIELSEYELTETPTGRMLYTVQTTTLHQDEAAAKRYVTARIGEDGFGPSLSTITGVDIPGRCWTMREAEVVNISIRAGDVAAVSEDFDDSVAGLEFPQPDDPHDPIPPDTDS